MNRKLKYIPVIIIITGLIITLSIIINNSIILTRIYYRINYKGNIQDTENIIDKSELFDYQKYCLCRDYLGDVYNLTDKTYLHHIDRDFLEFLKLGIEEDKTKFHLFPFYSHNFIYSLEATNESLIYLTYNNNSIIKAEYANHSEIFTAQIGHYDNSSLYWEGYWYLNFTLIPYAPNSSSTIGLNDIFLVKMNLYYHQDYMFGGVIDLSIKPYLCFNSKYQVMFVYFTYISVFVA